MCYRYNLILFDVDGTLLRPTDISRRSFLVAVRQICGFIKNVDDYPFSGKTDPQIIRELLFLHGLNQDEVNNKINRCLEIFVEDQLLSISRRKFYPCQGVPELLNELENKLYIGLVTGNMEKIVKPKLDSASIRYESFIVGAYGSDNADRNMLPDIAVQKARKLINQDINPFSVLIVGDTPLDIDCAHYYGSEVLAVATGNFTEEELRNHNPDYLLTDLSDWKRVFQILNGK